MARVARCRLAGPFSGRAVMRCLNHDGPVGWPRCVGGSRKTAGLGITTRNGAQGAEGLSHGSS
jgi:hypothetical protein